MQKWIKGKAIAVFIVVFLAKIKVSYSVPLPSSDSGPPAKVREKSIKNGSQHHPLFISAQANEFKKTFEDFKKDDNPSDLDIQALKFLKKAKMVKDLNPNSQKLFKDKIKKKSHL